MIEDASHSSSGRQPERPHEGSGDDHATGEPRVDAVLAELVRVDTMPVSGHAAVYDEVHRRLAEVLTTLDGE